jgi:hypothetical protein
MSAGTLQQIEVLLPNLTREEKVRLVSRLASDLQGELPQPSSTARGRWKRHFPADFDIDAALREIRGNWHEATRSPEDLQTSTDEGHD